MLICGVDIGKNGGACLITLNKEEIKIQLIETEDILKTIDDIKNTFIIMEKIFVSQKMNPQTSISFGMNKQKAIYSISDSLFFEVHPRSWQKYFYSKLQKGDKSKFKTIRDCYDKTIKILNVEVEGRENDGKRASVLIAFYGLYYILTDAVKKRKLKIDHYKFLEKHIEFLVKVKNKLYMKLISKVEEI